MVYNDRSKKRRWRWLRVGLPCDDSFICSSVGYFSKKPFNCRKKLSIGRPSKIEPNNGREEKKEEEGVTFLTISLRLKYFSSLNILILSILVINTKSLIVWTVDDELPPPPAVE